MPSPPGECRDDDDYHETMKLSGRTFTCKDWQGIDCEGKRYYLVNQCGVPGPAVSRAKLHCPDACGTCPGRMHGDPVFHFHGETFKLVLPAAQAVPLLSWKGRQDGRAYELRGATFGTGGEDVTAQWFGQFEIYVDGARKLDVLRATTEWERPTPGLKSMRVTFGGDASRGHGVFMTRHEQSRDGIDVAAVPLDGRAIGERPAEQLTVAAGGARLRIIDSAARKFNATVDRVHYSHLNLKLDEIPKDVAAAP